MGRKFHRRFEFLYPSRRVGNVMAARFLFPFCSESGVARGAGRSVTRRNRLFGRLGPLLTGGAQTRFPGALPTKQGSSPGHPEFMPLRTTHRRLAPTRPYPKEGIPWTDEQQMDDAAGCDHWRPRRRRPCREPATGRWLAAVARSPARTPGGGPGRHRARRRDQQGAYGRLAGRCSLGVLRT